MTVSRPRLVLVPGEAPLDPHLMESLRSIFEIVEAKDQAAAQQLVRDEAGAMLLCSADALAALAEQSAQDASTAAVHEIGDGMGIVDADGNLKWTNAKLRQFSQQVRRQFIDMCRESVSLFNEAAPDASTGDSHQNHRFSFEADSRHYELVTSRASSGTSDPEQVDAVIGVLWDVTRTRHLLDKLDAIDAAGSALMKLEASEITKLNAAERLDMLEQKIARYVHDLLGFDNFELRLVDRETGRLELVMAVGITADRIGEVINPELQGSGITGHVAATGQSYLCPNVKQDPLYREGLDNAASSLTVPLRLHDEVIGVFNIESAKLNGFDENDRRFATIFGRYIAMAMNILDLLVAERFTTNEQMSQTVLGELSEPLTEITGYAESLRDEHLADAKIRKQLDQIIDAAGRIRRRVESCTAGPRTILGAEHELHWGEPDPAMKGKRVLVADDDDRILKSVAELLTHKGCDVTSCANGSETLDTLKAANGDHADFDLVISDIKMPDHSGYEVFLCSKELSPDTPIILMTGFGYDPHHSIVRASQQGLHSFLFKPFKATQLLEEVKKALTAK